MTNAQVIRSEFLEVPYTGVGGNATVKRSQFLEIPYSTTANPTFKVKNFFVEVVRSVSSSLYKDFAYSWNVSNYLSKEFSYSYNVAALVKEFSYSWQTADIQLKEFAYSWNVQDNLTKEFAYSWNVQDYLTKNFTYSWNVQDYLTKEFAYSWNVQDYLTKNFTYSWKVQDYLHKEFSYSWNVLYQFKEFSSSWNVADAQTKEFTYSWIVPLVKTFAYSWNVSDELSQEFSYSWNVSTPSGKEFGYYWNVAQRVIGEIRLVTAVRRTVTTFSPSDSTNLFASLVSNLEPSIASEPSLISFDAPPSIAAQTINHTYGDIYFRTWILPPSLGFYNPVLGAKASVELWSAWNVPNVVTSWAVTGTPAITTDLAAPLTMPPSSSKIIDVSITDIQFNNIDSVVTFNFDHGTDRTLVVTAQVLLFDRKIPDVTVEESYNWLTNILTSFNGKEQRISIRGAPRRVIKATFRIEDDDESRRFQELIYRGNDSQIGVPMWQYASGLQSDVTIGTGVFQLDLSMTDVRPGDTFMAIDAIDDSQFEVFVVGSVSPTSLTTVITATKHFIAYQTILVPLMPGKIQDSSSIRFDTTWGETQLTVEESDGHDVTSRPNVPLNLVNQYDGFLIVDKRPLNTANHFAYMNSAQLIDFDIGLSVKDLNWTYSKKSVSREYVISRFQQANDMDYWKEFMAAANGAQKSFLMPTFNKDLTISGSTASILNTISVDSTFYGDQLFPQDSHKRMLFHTDQGDFLRKVVSIDMDRPNNATILTLDSSLPNTISTIYYVEYVLKCRLMEDKVTLKHDIDESTIAFTVITTDQT